MAYSPSRFLMARMRTACAGEILETFLTALRGARRRVFVAVRRLGAFLRAFFLAVFLAFFFLVFAIRVGSPSNSILRSLAHGSK